MKHPLFRFLLVLLVAKGLIAVDATPSHALGSFGTQTDTFCQSYNGTTPYADQSCALCHVNGVPPALNSTGTLFKNNGFAPSAAMCPVKNTAPVANAGGIAIEGHLIADPTVVRCPLAGKPYRIIRVPFA